MWISFGGIEDNSVKSGTIKQFCRNLAWISAYINYLSYENKI